MSTACEAAITARLAAAGGWLGRPELDAGLGHATARIHDQLADMVDAGAVLHNERTGQYRLAGTPLALSALKRLLAGSGEQQVSLLGRPGTDGSSYRVGMARRVPAADGAHRLVMCELALPAPGGFAAMVQMGFAVLALADRHGAAAQVQPA